MAKRFLLHLNSRLNHMKNENAYSQLLSGVINRYLSETPKSETELEKTLNRDEKSSNSDENDDELTVWKWKFESDWLSKALEPALQLYKWASFTKTDENLKIAPNNRSFSEILANLQRSKISIQDWSLSDFTVGLYLIYLSQASSNKSEEFNGVQIKSERIVKELIYNLELARGSYKNDLASLSKHTMLREKNIVKFIKDSSVMRPGFYIGIDTRNKLVVLGIRGTHTVYDIITDLVSSSSGGFGMHHFGSSEAARWYLENELGTIRRLLEKYKGYKLRFVGHSLGGAAAALLAIMLRSKSKEELGFSPDLISAVGFGTPPCVSREAAESCEGFVSTVVLQDDIIPRLSAASLARLRNEIIETDWMTILEKEDWKAVIDIVTNAKLVVSSIQDVARKLSEIAKFKDISYNRAGINTSKDSRPQNDISHDLKQQNKFVTEELFTPGKMYYLKREIEKSGIKSMESYTLWKRNAGEHFYRILLSGNLISDHRCDSHYYALRDVLKSLPRESDDYTSLL
ncbi:hypothetical protein LUZ60_012180 [Juncus effusus]|nr:hypothetical protein LUZ60_012180 [Juncus effusus]